jgi:CRP-like cAMP-binding protein
VTGGLATGDAVPGDALGFPASHDPGVRMKEPTERIDDLVELPFFAGLEREDVEEILRRGSIVSFSAGATLVERGDPGTEMYIILSGAAEVDVGGRFHRIEPGDFLGEMAVMAGNKRMATVRAVEDVEALRISAEDFEAILLQRPQVGVTILKRTVERLREVQERIDAWLGVW